MSRPVVLVSLDWERPDDPRSGLGADSLTAALRHADVAVERVEDAVNRPGFDEETFARRVEYAVAAAGPGAVVAIGAFVWNETEVSRLVYRLRRFARARIVLGGPQVSYAGPGRLESLYPNADVFVRGHGERAIVAIARDTHLDEQGVHVAGTSDRGARADFDLSVLPSPHLDGTVRPAPRVRWETQRGCPFRCTFCQHREAGARLRHRTLADERVLAEACAFAERGIQRISVLDPIFNANPGRALRLLQQFRAVGLHTAELSLQCRFEYINGAFLDALDGLRVTLEFGLQTIHAAEGRAVARINDMPRVERALAEVQERGIDHEVSLIYGLPAQTLDSFRQSVDWCLARHIPRVRAWPLMLLRGTPLHDARQCLGLVESKGERIPIVVASPTFSRDEHAQMAALASKLTHARPPAVPNSRGAA